MAKKSPYANYPFSKLYIGDCFKLADDMDGYRYIRVEDLYDPYMKVRVNAINLDTGYGKYFFDDKKVILMKISVRRKDNRVQYRDPPRAIENNNTERI